MLWPLATPSSQANLLQTDPASRDLIAIKRVRHHRHSARPDVIVHQATAFGAVDSVTRGDQTRHELPADRSATNTLITGPLITQQCSTPRTSVAPAIPPGLERLAGVRSRAASRDAAASGD